MVLAGTKPAIAAVQKALVEKGYSVVGLQVSAAFHTKLVGHAQKPFAEAIKQVKFNKPIIPVYSNTSGKIYGDDPEEIRRNLASISLTRSASKMRSRPSIPRAGVFLSSSVRRTC